MGNDIGAFRTRPWGHLPNTLGQHPARRPSALVEEGVGLRDRAFAAGEDLREKGAHNDLAPAAEESGVTGLVHDVLAAKPPWNVRRHPLCPYECSGLQKRCW